MLVKDANRSKKIYGPDDCHAINRSDNKSRLYFLATLSFVWTQYTYNVSTSDRVLSSWNRSWAARATTFYRKRLSVRKSSNRDSRRFRGISKSSREGKDPVETTVHRILRYNHPRKWQINQTQISPRISIVSRSLWASPYDRIPKSRKTRSFKEKKKATKNWKQFERSLDAIWIMYQENPIISQQWDVCVETVGSFFFYNLERSPMEKSQDIITIPAVKDI